MLFDRQKPIGFQYTPVAQGYHEIRVIILHPGSCEEGIRCEIRHVSFDESPAYEALSYTWGERTDPVQITLDESPFLVTQNLFLALRHLRDEKCARCLWVDAICINQKNTAERNNQVQQMARIYQEAKHVHVWLGPYEQNEPSKLAMSFLKEIDTRVLACTGSQSQLERVHEWIREIFDDKSYVNKWKALARLWERHYWSRVWIIQEVVFGTSNPRQCSVHCGTESIAWETVVALDRAMSLIDPRCYDNEHSEIDILQFSKGARLDLSWFIVTHGHQSRNKELKLSYLLIRQGRYKATDPRDKVYALLSMVHHSQADELAVDYGLSTAEVYTMAMKAMVLEEKRLGVLCVCSRECRNRDPLVQLPSWCPDFSTDPMDKCCPARLWSYTKPVYFASGSLNASANFLVKDGATVLSTRGWRIDTISVHPHDIEQGKGFLSLECLLFLARGIGGQTPTNLEGISEEAHEDIWRTLVANRGQSQDKAPESFREMYKSLVAAYVAPVNSTVAGRKDAIGRDLDSDTTEAVDPFREKMNACLRKRLLCKSNSRSLLGLVPGTAQDGDIICILIGCALPMILRRKKNHYVVIGESYVHGLMYGEILEMVTKGEIEQDYEIEQGAGAQQYGGAEREGEFHLENFDIY